MKILVAKIYFPDEDKKEIIAETLCTESGL